MLPQAKAKIFLSGERSAVQSETFRCYGTFDKNNLQMGKTPFGSLVTLNDITLAPGEHCKVEATELYQYVIIPVVGTIHFEGNVISDLVNPGQALFISLLEDVAIEITNPYADALVNFLQLGFSTMKTESSSFIRIIPFDLDNNKNKLEEISDSFEPNFSFPKISIGKFDGRQETVYTVSSEKNGLFVFVLEGAFEVEYRLMEAKDGLAIWEVKEIELEALSNEAIILTIELAL